MAETQFSPGVITIENDQRVAFVVSRRRGAEISRYENLSA